MENVALHTTTQAEYTYNSQNQRVKKILHKLDTDGAAFVHTFLYFYDQQGQLISEYKNGKPIRDYLWADNQPLQRDRIKLKNNGDTIVKNSLSLVTDHLNTPRIALDDSNTIVWRWDSNAFGKGGIDKDLDGDGSKHNIRLRFPGQYADPESGLYYNWNRYYDPQRIRLDSMAGLIRLGMRCRIPQGLRIQLVCLYLKQDCLLALLGLTQSV